MSNPVIIKSYPFDCFKERAIDPPIKPVPMIEIFLNVIVWVKFIGFFFLSPLLFFLFRS